VPSGIDAKVETGSSRSSPRLKTRTGKNRLGPSVASVEAAQDCQHAVVVAVGGGEAAIGEDVSDVLFGGPFGDDEGSGDRGVGAALGHRGEQLLFFVG
jgi:hypothetical protein